MKNKTSCKESASSDYCHTAAIRWTLPSEGQRLGLPASKAHSSHMGLAIPAETQSLLTILTSPCESLEPFPII